MSNTTCKAPTRNTDIPICPHCGYNIVNYWDFSWDAQEYIEVDCPSCEEEITIYVTMNPTFDTHVGRE